MTNDLLYHLYNLAIQYGGEIHASTDEVNLCFPSPVQSSPPKRQEDESWVTQNQAPAPTLASDMSFSTTTDTSSPSTRHVVLNDIKQFLREQEMQRLSQSLYEDGKKKEKFQTGEMPYRNYPDGRPPSR